MNPDHAFVIRENNSVIALLVLIEDNNGILLDNVAVDPAYQGHGIGRQLMAFAENTASALGHKKLNLYTHIVMVESFEIYKHLGYFETERKTVNGYQRIYMKKILEE